MKKFLPLIILGVLLAGVAWFVFQDGTPAGDGSETVDGIPTGDPLDVVNGFYSDWLAVRQGTTTDLAATGLLTDERLSETVQEYLANAQGDEQDAVLCQTALPERTVSRIISQTERRAEVQVLARGLETPSPTYAVVEVMAVAGEWQIGSITCQNAESGPATGEFSFDKEGFLLKSVPAPLNSDYWHLVFTENDVPGHTVPLYFDTESTCVAAGGEETVCDESQFSEPSRAQVQGAMTEAGVEVDRVTFQ